MYKVARNVKQVVLALVNFRLTGTVSAGIQNNVGAHVNEAIMTCAIVVPLQVGAGGVLVAVVGSQGTFIDV